LRHALDRRWDKIDVTRTGVVPPTNRLAWRLHHGGSQSAPHGVKVSFAPTAVLKALTGWACDAKSRTRTGSRSSNIFVHRVGSEPCLVRCRPGKPAGNRNTLLCQQLLQPRWIPPCRLTLVFQTSPRFSVQSIAAGRQPWGAAWLRPSEGTQPLIKTAITVAWVKHVRKQ